MRPQGARPFVVQVEVELRQALMMQGTGDWTIEAAEERTEHGRFETRPRRRERAEEIDIRAAVVTEASRRALDRPIDDAA